jgi:diguanylate cyclase (GGDEF)-like protein/PAS domain S-box-containing protein
VIGGIELPYLAGGGTLSPRVERRLVETLYAQTTAQITGCSAQVLLSLFEWRLTGNAWWLVWGALALVLLAWRLRGASAFRATAREKDSREWARRFAHGAWAIGALWGAGSLMVMTTAEDPLARVVLIAVQAGYVGGATVRNNASPAAALGQVYLTLVPLVVACLGTFDTNFMLFGVFVALHILANIALISFVSAQTVKLLVADESNARLLTVAADERDSAQRYLDIAGVIILTLSPEGMVAGINRKGCEVLGATEAEILGQPWFDRFIPVSHRETMREAFRHLITGDMGEVGYYENPVLTNRGEERLLAWHIATLRDAQGRCVSILSSGEDVTEARRADGLLRDSEARYRVLIERAPEAILVYDAATRLFIDANANAERLFDCTRAELLKFGPQHYYQLGQPDARPIANTISEHDQRALAGEEVIFERRILTASGAERWCEVRLVMLPQADKNLLRASFIEITERKLAESMLRESEERFRTVFASANDGIFISDLKSGRFVEVNQPGCDMFGYTHDEIVGATIKLLVSGMPSYTYRDAILCVDKARSGGPQRVEWRCKTKDGRLFWVDIALRYATFGGREWVLATVRDITERRNAVAALLYRDTILHAVTLSTAALVTDRPLAESMPSALRTTGEAMGVDRLLVLQNPAGGAVSLCYAWQAPDVPLLDTAFMTSFPGGLPNLDAWFEPLLAGKPVITHARSAQGHVAEIMQRMKNRSTLLVPITIEGRYWGHIGADDCKNDREWSQGDIDSLGMLAEVIGAAIARERTQASLLQSEERFHTIFESVTDGIFVNDGITGKISDANRRVCDLFGYSRDEILECDIGTLSSGVSPYTREDAAAYFKAAKAGEIQNFEWHCKAKDGKLFWVEVTLRRVAYNGRDFLLSTAHDITTRKEAEQRITQMAHFDGLTGLANRGVFVAALERAIAGARFGGKGFAVLYLDLDHFKDVNDTLGHPIGDLLLQAIARRLQSSARKTDTVARFGGDEFAVIAADISDPADAAELARKILESIKKPMSLEGNTVRTGASVGIAVYGSDSPAPEALLSHADVALYRAKSEERGTYRFFTEAMDIEVRTRVTMTDELREAIAADQLFLVYQPQVDAETGRLVGVEALVRWLHPKRGIIGPDQFIPIAEKSGLIVSLGRKVMCEACRQMKEWLDAGIAPPLIAVNVSGLQFKTPLELETDVAAVLNETELPARRLELELTESALMRASGVHNDVLLRLRQRGVRIAIDDFGTGYSSLEYLSQFPVDRIKIAQSFIRNWNARSSNTIVKAAIGLARDLDLDVLVEGVETGEQLEMVKSWGCKEIQGYYFSRPLPAREITNLLRAGGILHGQPLHAEVA